jgi:hypothetical protein
VNRHLRRGLTGLAAATMVLTVATTPAGATKAEDHLNKLRYVTAPYFDIGEAEEDGYGMLRDAAGIACIESDEPGAGAMGIHYVNGALVEDPRVRLLHPELLIYEQQEDGDMELIALEYVVLKSAWRAEHPHGRPKLLGRTFELVKEGNRYGLPDFYELHVWAWRPNPSGMFTDFNPKVSCEFAPPVVPPTGAHA